MRHQNDKSVVGKGRQYNDEKSIAGSGRRTAVMLMASQAAAQMGPGMGWARGEQRRYDAFAAQCFGLSGPSRARHGLENQRLSAWRQRLRPMRPLVVKIRSTDYER